MYRTENDIDNLVSNDSYDKFNRDLPFKIGGRDREGRPSKQWLNVPKLL